MCNTSSSLVPPTKQTKNIIIKSRHTRFVEGSLVSSTYRGRWHGIVLAKTDCNYVNQHDFVVPVLILRTQEGKRPRKRIIRQYHVSWLKPCTLDLDLATVNPDWYNLDSYFAEYLKKS